MEIVLNRKQQIDLTATALFKKRGYAATSMRDLANELGIEAASIYSHIRSKEEILQRICFRMANEFFETIAKTETNEISATTRLHHAIISHVYILTKNTDASAVFLNEWRHLSEPYHTDFLAMRNRYETHFAEIIHDGLRSGEFSVPDEKFAVLTILSSLNWLHTWYKPEGNMKPDEIATNLAIMLLNGIKQT
jgi:TetR/AcrR family transcriptional regulator, cholesterol catabolism regulator